MNNNNSYNSKAKVKNKYIKHSSTNSQNLTSIGLINKIAELEDENYKIIHSNKDNMSKKKFIVMEKQFQKLKIGLFPLYLFC